jgi:phospholipase/carboxylesterase
MKYAVCLFTLLSTLLFSCSAQQSMLPQHLYKKGDNSTGAAPLVILLHGYGSNAEDLFGLANSFPANTHVVAFNGLFKLDSDAYSWFQFEVGSDGIRTIDESQELQSRKAIESWIPLLIEETGADPNRVFLFGFSQGAIMSASVLTDQPALLKGIIALSGRYLPSSHALKKDPSSYVGKKAFVGHGFEDQVLPYSNGEQLKEALNNLNVPVAFKTYYGMGHSISQDEMKDVVNWFNFTLLN